MVVKQTNTHNYNNNDMFTPHSSAGVGRTGTFIALDYLTQQAAAESAVDIKACVYLMRTQRMKMIQTLVRLHG